MSRAYRISRAPAAAGEAPYDAFAKLVFEPPLESDELFDALRESYPSLKTHTERKKQAVLDFLMEERQAIEQEITAFVQQTGTPAPPTDVSTYSARPSPSFSAASSVNLRKLSASNSSSSSSTRSGGSSPETMSLKDMTSVWTAAGHGKPKIHTRRSMTTKEKEEYRRRRQMKACKECRSRKRKCIHDPSEASSAASPHTTDAKVKKRTSAAASHPHPPQSFPSSEFDTSSFLADSAFTSSTDSPMDFLDFSPATGTDGSFDDFLLLPNDDFASIDFATDPLFQSVPQQSFSCDPFTQQQPCAQSTGSRSPASTYQSSGMSRSGSNALFSPAQAFDASQSWSFDLLDAAADTSSGRAQQASFRSGATDGKHSGLAAGLSPVSQPSHQPDGLTDGLLNGLTDGLTPAVSPTSMNMMPVSRRSHATSRSSESPAAGPDASTASTALRLSEGNTTLVHSPGRTRRESWQPVTNATTATHTLNAHTATALPGDVDDILHASPDWFNDGRRDNDARRDGLVLGTDPSAGSRFGEHGHSTARRATRITGRLGVSAHAPQQPVFPFPDGAALQSIRSPSWEIQAHTGEAPLSSRNPTSVNDPASARNGDSTARRRGDHLREGRVALATAPNSRGAELALADSRQCKGKNPERTTNTGSSDQARVHKLLPVQTGSKAALTTIHTRPSSLRDADGASVNLQRRSVLWSELLDHQALLFSLASFVSTLVVAAVSSLLAILIASTSRRDTDVSSDGRRRSNDVSFGGVSSSSLIEHKPKTLARVTAWRQEWAKPAAGGGKVVCTALLHGLSHSRVFV